MRRSAVFQRPAGPFVLQSLTLAILVSTVIWAPILLGKIPLPTDLFLYLPPYTTLAKASPPPARHAEVGDLLVLMYPWRSHLAEAFQDRSLPFWNPHSFAGDPFLANPISAAFYPINWLYALLPVPIAWSIQFPIRTAIAFFLTALLARRVGASRTGAMLSGAIFSLCGFVVAWQGWPQVDALMWTPLILLLVIGARRRPTLKRGGFLAAALAMTILSGHPEVSLYALLTGAAFAAFQFAAIARRTRGARKLFRFALTIAFAGAVAAGICAVQIWPSVEWVTHITRSVSGSWPSRPLQDVVALVSRDAGTSPSSSGLAVPDGCVYAGIVTLLLAPFALGAWRRGFVWFFLVLALAAAGIVFGMFPFSTVFRALPVLRAMPGTRALGELDLALAVLAGLGFSALAEMPTRRGRLRPRNAMVTLSTSFVFVGIALVVLERRFERGGSTGPLETPFFAGALLVAAAALFCGWILLEKRARLIRSLIPVLLAVDLATFSFGHVPFVSRDSLYPDQPVFSFLQTRSPPGSRVVFLNLTVPRNVGMMYGLDSLDGYPQVLKETAVLLKGLNRQAPWDDLQPAFSVIDAANADPRLLDLLGVRYLVANVFNETAENLEALGRVYPLRWRDPGVRVYENSDALPRVFAVPKRAVRVAPGPEAAYKELFSPGFDPRFSVVLEKGTALREGTPELPLPPAREPAAVRRLRLGMNSVEGEVLSDESQVVVMTQKFYPGWRGSVDGAPSEVLRADSAFCAMVIPPGAHRFRFYFRPKFFELATAISLTGLGLLLASLIVGTRPQRFTRARIARPSRNPGG